MKSALVFGFVRACCVGLVVLATLVQPSVIRGQSITVRTREGYTHGFLVLRTLDGATVASGELTQIPHGDRVTAHMIFHFKDGSLDDETTVYSQRRNFHLVSNHHVQKGPSFPHPFDAFIDTASQQVTVQEEGVESAKIEHMELPPDLANGLVLTLMRNLRRDTPEIEIPYVAVASKPRIVKLAISKDGTDRFKVGRVYHKTFKYVIRVRLGGVTGVVAPVVGKQPADSHVWITSGIVPTVVRVDAPLYTGGPVWSVQLATPVW